MTNLEENFQNIPFCMAAPFLVFNLTNLAYKRIHKCIAMCTKIMNLSLQQLYRLC